jgi:hypothetical protein
VTGKRKKIIHPHPGPLPSREREFFVRGFIGGKRGIFISFSLDPGFQNPYTHRTGK